MVELHCSSCTTPFPYQYGDVGNNLKSNNIGYWIPILANSNYWGSEANVRSACVPGIMVASNGKLYVVYFSGFNQYGPVLDVACCTYNNGNVSRTCRNSSLYPWYTFYGTTIGTTPIVSGETAPYLKTFFHNALQPVIAQDINVNDDKNLWIGVFNPSEDFINGQTFRDGTFTILKIKTDFSDTSSSSITYLSFFSTSSQLSDNEIPYLSFRSMVRRKASTSYVYPNETGNFKLFRYKNSNTTYTGFYFIAQEKPFLNDITGDPHDYRLSYARGDADGLVPHKVQAGTPSPQGEIFDNRHLTMSPRLLKIGDYIYSVILVNGCYFKLCKQALSAVGPTCPTGVNKSHDMETSTLTKYKDTPYPYDFCLLEENGNPCTSSSDTSATSRRIWCNLCFGCCYDLLTTNFGWGSDYCKDYNGEIACVLRSYYLQANDGNNWTQTGDWVQNAVYFTGAKRGEEKTTVAGVSSTSDNKYQIHLNTHKMVPYHNASSNKNYFIFAYCCPDKAKQLYLAYAQYIVDSAHNVRLLTKIQFSKGNWGNSLTGLTSCSRIISMDLVGDHLWICFMNSDNTKIHYFHCLAQDLINEG